MSYGLTISVEAGIVSTESVVHSLRIALRPPAKGEHDNGTRTHAQQNLEHRLRETPPTVYNLGAAHRHAQLYQETLIWRTNR